MAYTSPAIYMQRRVGGGPGPDPDDCDAYTRPSPVAVTTNLIDIPVFQSPTTVETNLCAPVS